MTNRYQATGLEASFQPGSRRRVLRNRLGIVRVREMQAAESEALLLAQQTVLGRFDARHRFTAADVREIHRVWLGPIYEWAGDYRTVDIGRDGFRFAHARFIPNLMAELESGPMARLTPCSPGPDDIVAGSLADVHAELVLIHPFREGNGRVARLVAVLMALQAGLPPLDFAPMTGTGRLAYIAAIHEAMARDYRPLSAIFERIIARSRRAAANDG